MTEKVLNFCRNDDQIETQSRFANDLKNYKYNVDYRSVRALTKLERESLFNEAENLRFAGNKNESADIYMRCLFNLDVKTAFPSLPQCLRALANFFLETNQYVKAIHFVQAERLYYESALLDAAALQQKLIDMTSGKKFQADRINFPVVDVYRQDISNSQARLAEYGHLTTFYKERQSFELAMLYAQKCVKLSTDLFGTDSVQTKASHSLLQNLVDETVQEKIALGTIVDSDENFMSAAEEKEVLPSTFQYHQSKIFNLRRLEINENGITDEDDQDAKLLDEKDPSYRGCSASVAIGEVSDITDTSTHANLKPILSTDFSAIYPVLKIVSKFVLISLIFIISSTLVLVVINHVLLSLRHTLFPEQRWAEDDDRLILDNHPVTLHTEIFFRPMTNLFSRLLKLFSLKSD